MEVATVLLPSIYHYLRLTRPDLPRWPDLRKSLYPWPWKLKTSLDGSTNSCLFEFENPPGSVPPKEEMTLEAWKITEEGRKFVFVTEAKHNDALSNCASEEDLRRICVRMENDIERYVERKKILPVKLSEEEEFVKMAEEEAKKRALKAASERKIEVIDIDTESEDESKSSEEEGDPVGSRIEVVTGRRGSFPNRSLHQPDLIAPSALQTVFGDAERVEEEEDAFIRQAELEAKEKAKAREAANSVTRREEKSRCDKTLPKHLARRKGNSQNVETIVSEKVFEIESRSNNSDQSMLVSKFVRETEDEDLIKLAEEEAKAKANERQQKLKKASKEDKIDLKKASKEDKIDLPQRTSSSETSREKLTSAVGCTVYTISDDETEDEEEGEAFIKRAERKAREKAKVRQKSPEIISASQKLKGISKNKRSEGTNSGKLNVNQEDNLLERKTNFSEKDTLCTNSEDEEAFIKRAEREALEKAKVRQKTLSASPEIPSTAQKANANSNKKKETEDNRSEVKTTERRSAGKTNEVDKFQKCKASLSDKDILCTNSEAADDDDEDAFIKKAEIRAKVKAMAMQNNGERDEKTKRRKEESNNIRRRAEIEPKERENEKEQERSKLKKSAVEENLSKASTDRNKVFRKLSNARDDDEEEEADDYGGSIPKTKEKSIESLKSVDSFTVEKEKEQEFIKRAEMEAKAKAMKKQENFGQCAMKHSPSSIRNSVEKTEKKKDEASQSRSARRSEAKSKRKKNMKEGKRSSNTSPITVKEESRDEGEEAFIKAAEEEAFIKAAEEEAKAKALRRMGKANPINTESEQKCESDEKKALSSISPALVHMIQRASNIPRKTKETEDPVGKRKDTEEIQNEDDELSAELPNPVSCVSFLDEDISTDESMVLPLPVPVSHKTPPIAPTPVESSESPCSPLPPTPHPTSSSTSHLTSSPASADVSSDPSVSVGTLGIASPPASVPSSQIASVTSACPSSPTPVPVSSATPNAQTRSSLTQPKSSSSPLSSKSPEFKCPKCSWTGKTQGVLTRHMNTKHK